MVITKRDGAYWELLRLIRILPVLTGSLRARWRSSCRQDRHHGEPHNMMAMNQLMQMQRCRSALIRTRLEN